MQYGRLVEAARAEIETQYRTRLAGPDDAQFRFPEAAAFAALLTAAGASLWIYQVSGLQKLLRATGLMSLLGRWAAREALAPAAEIPFFFREYRQDLSGGGRRRSIAWRSWRAASRTSPSRG